MVFRRNLHPVNSYKHVVDRQSAIVAGTQEQTVLVNASDTPTLSETDEVAVGSTVSSIYLNVSCYATTQAALANVYIVVYKNPGGNLVAITPNTVGSNNNKKFVIHQEMRMNGGSTTEIPVSIFRGVIKIPRGYKRFGIADALVLNILSPGVNIDYCVQCIYKEIR